MEETVINWFVVR